MNMKRNFAMGLLLSTLMLLVSVSICRSQEAPEPPEPPEAPDSELEGVLAQVGTIEGSAHLGVTLKDVSTEKARELKLPGEYGALVVSVDEDSAAAKAGLQKGDVIVEFAGERVRSEAQLRRLIRETPAGRTVILQVIRDGQARSLNAKLQARSNQFYFQAPDVHIPQIEIRPDLVAPFGNHGFAFMAGSKPTLGISGEELTSQLASYFGVKQGRGVLVSEVVAGSPAAQAGLKAGDIIVAVDKKQVATVAELRKALELKSGEDKRQLNLTVVRDRHEQTVPVELKRPELLEDGKEEAGLGSALGDWQRAEAEAKKQLAAAQLALQQAQRPLGDQQRLLSDQARRAAEKYREAVREQLKDQLKLQLEKQLKIRTEQEIKLRLQEQLHERLQERLHPASAQSQTI
jgi:membrane-associated protease RseP (regulator of RpoE activity)